MADVAATLAGWSSTTGSNAPSGGTTIGTGLDDNLREIQGVIVRGLSHKGADIASATTTDLGAVEGLAHDITGTTTITGFGTVRAGIWKVIKFEGALTLTHNATSLILPGAANITTADGDTAIVISEGAGNWRCVAYVRASAAITSSISTMATARLLGRTTASTGAIEEISVARGLDLSSGVLTGITRLPRRASGATETLVAADLGKVIVTSTASTLTLPLLSAASDGDVIGFSLNGTVDVTVQRQSTDELSWGTASGLNAVKLTQYGDYLILWADKTSSRWRVLSDGIMGPSFAAQYQGAGQSIGTNTVTKLQFNTEISDSHAYYDPATNYRFTPLIPGWYMVSVSAYINPASASRGEVYIYKNGSVYMPGQRSYTNFDGVYTVSAPVFFNGSTDYVEAYGNSLDAAGTFDDTIESQFTAVRIR